MSTRTEIVQLRLEVITILDRLDELSLSFDDPEEKLALQRAINKLSDAEINPVQFGVE